MCTQYISNIKNNKIFFKENMKNKNCFDENNLIKTLEGKENYYFLINDTQNSLINHCKEKNENLISNFINIYDKWLSEKKILLFIFPDKEIICKKFLPDEFTINNRNKLDYYKKKFNENIIDTTLLFKIDDFDKSETHINLKGMIKFFNFFIETLNNKFNFNLNNFYRKTFIKEKKIANGDLLNRYNIGNNVVKLFYEDVYFTSDDLCFINKIFYKTHDFILYDSSLNNVSENFINKKIIWDDFKKFIIYSKNLNSKVNLKVLILHDSFLASTIKLYHNIFRYTYSIRHKFSQELIDFLKPDLIFELKIERFLS